MTLSVRYAPKGARYWVRYRAIHICRTDLPSDSAKAKKQLQKWKLLVSYDGTNYSGWQYQPKFPSVQGTIEDALSKLTSCTREELVLVGAGRTDAGVHALGQVAHFWTPFWIDDLERMLRGLNGSLPHDIRVGEVCAVGPEFHAQRSALKKKYRYSIWTHETMNPLERLYAYHVSRKLDIHAMQQACCFFVGKHDFTTFSNRHRPERNGVREIFDCQLMQQGCKLSLEVEGTGFLHKQIRNMVGLLLAIGSEGLPPALVVDLMASRDRIKLAAVCKSAPSRGLTLVSVNYSSEESSSGHS